jgi:hypothetical protein
MNRMKPAFLISMFGAQALAVPTGFGGSGLAIGAEIAAPIHCERPCLQLAYAYELARKGSRRACSRDTIGCEWSQASARATAFAANSPFPYAHRNDWNPPIREVSVSLPIGFLRRRARAQCWRTDRPEAIQVDAAPTQLKKEPGGVSEKQLAVSDVA